MTRLLELLLGYKPSKAAMEWHRRVAAQVDQDAGEDWLRDNLQVLYEQNPASVSMQWGRA